MSAALQLPFICAGSAAQAPRPMLVKYLAAERQSAPKQAVEPLIVYAFYRKHTERMLRRYLYASMQVGRAPSILSDPVARGWVSSRPVKTFEDAVIFVLDIENCLKHLDTVDTQLLSRICLQEYTQAETAALLGMSIRAISYKYPQALDKLTKLLLDAGLLVIAQD